MFIIADGNNIAWAGYHALRRSMEPTTPEQKVRTALLGLTAGTIGLAARAGEPPAAGSPAHIAARNAGRVSRFAVAFDEGRPIRRRAIWPAYQTGRESDPQFMENEIHIVEAIRQFSEMARMLPIEVARGINTEADDLMACLALGADAPVRIASTDRDFMQLLGERISIYSPVKRVVIDVSNFDEHGPPKGTDKRPILFPRERYLDYRVASGDSSDDLPGLPGLGSIGAARLLALAPLDDYLSDPSSMVSALGRQNARLSSAIRAGEAHEIVARNRVLMDLRAAAARYDSLDGMHSRGSWDEAGFRAWLADQRIAGLDTQAAIIAMDALTRIGR